jgi:hypothetical protein
MREIEAVWVESGEEVWAEGKGGRDRSCCTAVVGLPQTTVEMLEIGRSMGE